MVGGERGRRGGNKERNVLFSSAMALNEGGTGQLLSSSVYTSFLTHRLVFIN